MWMCTWKAPNCGIAPQTGKRSASRSRCKGGDSPSYFGNNILRDQTLDFSNPHSPIANTQHRFTISTINSVLARTTTESRQPLLFIYNAKCKRMLRIGDWRMPIGEVQKLVPQVCCYQQCGILVRSRLDVKFS